MDEEGRTFNEGDMFTYVNMSSVTCVLMRGPTDWSFVTPKSHLGETRMSDLEMLNHVMSLLKRNGSHLRWGFVHTGGER